MKFRELTWVLIFIFIMVFPMQSTEKPSFMGYWKVMRKYLALKGDWAEDFWVIYVKNGKTMIWDVQPSYHCEGELRGNVLKCKWYADIGEIITTIKFSEDGKHFTGETDFYYYSTHTRAKELLRGFREGEKVDLSEPSEESSAKKKESSSVEEPVKFEFSDLSKEPSLELKNGEWAGLPGTFVFSDLNGEAKIKVVDGGEAAIFEGDMKIVTPSAEIEMKGGRIKLTPQIGVIRPPTLSERFFGGFRFWYNYSVAPGVKKVDRGIKRGAKWVWKNKVELLTGMAAGRFITITTGIPGWLLTLPTKYISIYLGEHYDEIIDGIKNFTKGESKPCLNEVGVGFAMGRIKSKAIIGQKGEGTFYVYILEGEGELSDASGRKTVKIPAGYYSMCRKGGIPLNPMPFNREDIEKIWPSSEQPQGAVARWNFDEGRGSTVSDIAGQNNGRVYGAHWTEGISGTALSFDGVNDYVEVPHSPNLSLLKAITISVWIKQNRMDSLDRTIIARGASTTDFSNYDLRVLKGKIRFLFKSPSSSWVAYSTNERAVQAGKWTHIVLTHAWGNPSSTKIYVDGEEKPGTWIAGTGYEKVPSIVSPLYISGSGRLKGFNGEVDEVSIWRRSLSPHEIEAIARSSSRFSAHFEEKFSEAQYTSPEGTLLFYDNFERHELGPDWHVQEGVWKVEQGKLKAVGKNGVLWLNREFPDNIVVEAEIQGPYDLNIGIAGNGKSNSGYIFDFGGWWNSRVALVEGERIVRENTGWKITNPRRIYRLKIKRIGSRITCFIDGKKVFEYRDAKFFAKDGFNKISLRNWSFPITFDNIRVYSIKQR